MLGLTYKYYHKQASEEVFLVLHGGGPNGVESPFISKIIEVKNADHSYRDINRDPIYQDLVIKKLLEWIEGGDDE
jgi:hypothetical protein